MSTVYYTFNDCITGEPAVIAGFTYFKYIGDGFVNPADLLGKTISGMCLGPPGECFAYLGCWTLTKFNGIPTNSIIDWDKIANYTSSPSCEDCQYRVVGFVNPCVEASDGISFKVLASELSSYLVEDSFYIYNGPPVTSNSGGNMVPGYCYLFGVGDVSDPSAGLSIAPAVSNFTLSNRDTCLDISCTNVLRDCCTDEILELNGKPLVLTGFPPDEYINKIITALYTEGSFPIPDVTGCVKISIGIPYEVEDVFEVGWNEITADTVNTCAECQTCYYEIVNCSNSNEKYCTASNLSMYLNTGIANPAQWPVIEVIQFPGKCFYVQRIETCTAPISITKKPSTPTYTGCAQCLAKQIKYYKLINCNNPSIVVYTSTDLKEYLGKYITLEEYGDDCFYVEVTQDLVPSDTQVTPTGDKFQTCEECSLPKYLLKDCADKKPNIVTTTDLSQYVGSVIVISTCPDTCWEVEETEISVVNGNVNVINEFEDCPECFLATLTAKCISFTNTSSEEIEFTAVLPNLQEKQITLSPGQSTSKDCYLLWFENPPVSVKEFGNCVDGKCPTISKRKRKVTPGYDTPACTPEYYEKVECNFSEWMYKDVLEQRYGISNCCPEELIRWEIKHEMLMLDSLVNPDYDCMPPVNCGCQQPTTCNCSCNSGN